MIWFILLLIFLFFVIPITFLLIGVSRRHKKGGFFFFMFGIFGLALPLTELILVLLRWFFGAPADSDNGQILFFPILCALMYGGFRLYMAVQYYPHNILIRNVKRIVSQMSDAELPSCVPAVTSNVLQNASQVHDYHVPEVTACYAALIACMNLIATRKYHSAVTGALTDVGNQLVYVSQNCLEYLSRKKVIDEHRLSAFHEELDNLSFYDDRLDIFYMDL